MVINQSSNLSNSMNERIIKIIASIGLITGGLLGLAGSFAPTDLLRYIAWNIDGVGLIIACILLTLYYYKKGSDITAAGFMIFALGECAIVSSNSIHLEDNVYTFGAGTALWALSLLVISSQKTYSLFIRSMGILSAILFSIVTVLIFTDHPLNGLTRPLPFFAYPFFVITILGWAWSLWRPDTSNLKFAVIHVSAPEDKRRRTYDL